MNPFALALDTLGLSYNQAYDLSNPEELSTDRNRGQYIARICNGMISVRDSHGSLSHLANALVAYLEENESDPKIQRRLGGFDNLSQQWYDSVGLSQDTQMSWAERLAYSQEMTRDINLGDLSDALGLDLAWPLTRSGDLPGNSDYAVAKFIQVPITWVQRKLPAVKEYLID